ncbi:MAG: hypothetical protein HY096_01440 [Nitrospinae bacterium]|nr:hypothetical protein [Nitrospinota bacterium]
MMTMKKIDWGDLKDKIDKAAKLITNLIILVQVPAVILFLILINYLIRQGATPPSGIDFVVSYLMLVFLGLFFFIFCFPALMIPVILQKKFQWNPEEIQLEDKALSFLDKIWQIGKSLWNAFREALRNGKEITGWLGYILTPVLLLCFPIILLISWIISVKEILPVKESLEFMEFLLLVGMLSFYLVFYVLFLFRAIFSKLGLISSINFHFFFFFSLLYFKLKIPSLWAFLLSSCAFIYLVILSLVLLVRIKKDEPFTVARDIIFGGMILIFGITFTFQDDIIPVALKGLNLAIANEKVIYLNETLKTLYKDTGCVEVVWRSKEQVVLRKKENNKVWIVPGDKVSFESCQK